MASGSRHIVMVKPEQEYAVYDQTGNFDTLRLVDMSINVEKDTLESNEITGNRQVVSVRVGAARTAGELSFELSYGTYDFFLQTALQSEGWGRDADTGTTTLDSTDEGIVRATGSFVADGFEAGQLVTVFGFDSDEENHADGRFIVGEVTETLLKLDDFTLAGKVGDGVERVASQERIRNGNKRESFTCLRNYSDMESDGQPYHLFRGLEVSAANLNIAANSIVTGSFTVLGSGENDIAHTFEQVAGTVAINPPSNSAVVDSFNGKMFEFGREVTLVTQLSLTMDNLLSERYVVGKRNSLIPSTEDFVVTGSMSAYMEDSTFMQRFLNEEETQIELSMPDPNGNEYVIILPRVRFTDAKADVSGKGDITNEIPIQALANDKGFTIEIQKRPYIVPQEDR